MVRSREEECAWGLGRMPHWTFPAIPPPPHDLLTLCPASCHHCPYAKGYNQLLDSHSQEDTWPPDPRGILWGISHCPKCHFINADLGLAYLTLAVKHWMTLVLQVETPRTLGEIWAFPLQPVLRKLWMGVLEAGGGPNSLRRNLSL